MSKAERKLMNIVFQELEHEIKSGGKEYLEHLGKITKEEVLTYIDEDDKITPKEKV